MSAHSGSLILHQYDMSPFSEKIRAVFGIKGLEWHACDQPTILPKPELQALTGGYRRIPVLQIGADLYFDTVLILDVLEQLFPVPSLYGGSGPGIAQAFAGWTDQTLFWQVVVALFGGDIPPNEAFMADRSALLGRPFDAAAMKAAAPAAYRQLAACFDLIERQLADGRDYLFGSHAGAADASVYHNVAFLRWGRGKAASILDAFPHVQAWEARMRAIGHGLRLADVSRETAIGIARDSTPRHTTGVSLRDDMQPGDTLRIAYNDANTPPLTATLLAADHQGVSVRPLGLVLNNIVIHMPFSTARITRE
jgi:glutathione S-transferase